MAGNRKAAEAVCLEMVEALLPGGGNLQIYQNFFAQMDDQAFESFINGLDEGSIRLAIIAPINSQAKLDTARNLELAKKWGHNFFERIWMDGKEGSPPYLSPKKYLVVDLPIRRQAQFQVKKISIPEHTRSVDNLTGQPTGASKGSKISYPELQILAALGLNECIVEFIKFRGGDEKGFDAMNKSIAETGGVSLAAIDALGTQVRSKQTVSTLLTAMHLKNTLM